jgi:hypothetical protein
MSRFWAKLDERNAERLLKLVLPSFSTRALSTARVERDPVPTRRAVFHEMLPLQVHDEYYTITPDWPCFASSSSALICNV